jgi:hypothetical protein
MDTDRYFIARGRSEEIVRAWIDANQKHQSAAFVVRDRELGGRDVAVCLFRGHEFIGFSFYDADADVPAWLRLDRRLKAHVIRSNLKRGREILEEIGLSKSPSELTKQLTGRHFWKSEGSALKPGSSVRYVTLTQFDEVGFVVGVPAGAPDLDDSEPLSRSDFYRLKDERDGNREREAS